MSAPGHMCEKCGHWYSPPLVGWTCPSCCHRSGVERRWPPSRRDRRIEAVKAGLSMIAKLKEAG